MRPTFKKLEVTDLGKLEKLVAENIEGIEPGLRVVDSRLFLGQAAIDLVAVDARQSLVLVALDFTADEGLLLRVMDAYSWCLEYADTLRRLYPMANVSETRPPRILFIVERLTDAFVRRIKQLSFLEIDCLEFRHLEVNGASAVYFDLVQRLRRAAPSAPTWEGERVITTTAPPTARRVEAEPPVTRPVWPRAAERRAVQPSAARPALAEARPSVAPRHPPAFAEAARFVAPGPAPAIDGPAWRVISESAAPIDEPVRGATREHVSAIDEPARPAAPEPRPAVAEAVSFVAPAPAPAFREPAPFEVPAPEPAISEPIRPAAPEPAPAVAEPAPLAVPAPEPAVTAVTSAVPEPPVSLKTRLSELFGEASGEMPSSAMLSAVETEAYAAQEEPGVASVDAVADAAAAAEELMLQLETVDSTGRQEEPAVRRMSIGMATNPNWEALLGQLRVELAAHAEESPQEEPAQMDGAGIESTERADDAPTEATVETTAAVVEAAPGAGAPEPPARTLPVWAKPPANAVVPPNHGRTYFFSQAVKGPAGPQQAAAPVLRIPAPALVPAAEAKPEAAKPTASSSELPGLEAVSFPKDGLSRQWLEFLNQLGGAK